VPSKKYYPDFHKKKQELFSCDLAPSGRPASFQFPQVFHQESRYQVAYPRSC